MWFLLRFAPLSNRTSKTCVASLIAKRWCSFSNHAVADRAEPAASPFSEGHATAPGEHVNEGFAREDIRVAGTDNVLRDASVTTSATTMSPLGSRIVESVRAAIPFSAGPNELQLLTEAKSASEIRRLLTECIYRDALCWDVLNGHGFRVAAMQALSAACLRCAAVAEWFDCVGKFRAYGVVISRSNLAEAFQLVQMAMMVRFRSHGRCPSIVSDGLNRIRQLLLWSAEDHVVLDLPVFTKCLSLAGIMVSFFDRQNIFRSNFSDEFCRRDGVVMEWVVADRCVDYDAAVELCSAFVDEVVDSMRRVEGMRPTLGFMYRLADFYFCCDNPESMLAVLEDCIDLGIPVPESSTAKLLQLACAFNHPLTKELFMRFRAQPSQCVLAAPDVSRLLFFHARSGAGKPCPQCGEPYNHRHVAPHVWKKTPEAQRNCTLLETARHRKSELEDMDGPPQNADHSAFAFQMHALSQERSIPWGASEWRAFVLCCMNSPRALEAARLLEEQFPEPQFDEFLRQAHLRLLRRNHPEELERLMGRYFENKPLNRVSPIALQEALLCAASVSSSQALRVNLLRRIWALVLERDTYVMPYTSRMIQRLHRDRVQQRAASAVPSVSPLDSEEDALANTILTHRPRSLNLLDVKDGVSDFAVGSSKKNVYVASTVERSVRDELAVARKESRKRRSAESNTTS